MDTPPPPPPQSPSSSGASQWPKLIGIIATIFGALGLLQTAMAPLMIPFTRRTMESSIGGDEEVMEKLDSYMNDLTALSTLSSLIFAILAILLLVGGILLIKRKPIAKPILLTWAVLKIAGGAFVNYKNYGLTQRQFEILAPAMSGPEGEMFNNITNVSSTIGLAFGMLWLIALPVFLMIWFSRAKIREDMSTW